MKTVDPTAEGFRDALANVPRDTPVVMLNLLKYKQWADYGDGQKSISGKAAYERYLSEAMSSLQDYHAQIIWKGSAKCCLIAPAGEDWDSVLLVRYASIQTFVDMAQTPRLAEIMVHRTAGLDDSRLIATTEERF